MTDTPPPKSGLRWHEAPTIPQSIRATFDEGIAYAEHQVAIAPEQPERSVHEYRKSVRRLRAIVKLLREVLGPKAYRSLNTGLQSAVQPTSGLRDARVLLATLRTIPKSEGTKELRKALKAEWEARCDELGASDEESRVLAASHAPLDRIARDLAAALPTTITPENLRDAVRSSYRRARALFREAVRDPEDEAIHDVRKRVKELRYQLEWLRDVSDDETRARNETLARLARDLGEVTDLIVLENAILTDRERWKGLHPKRLADRIRRRVLTRFEEVIEQDGAFFATKSKPFVSGVARELDAPGGEPSED